MGITHAVNIMRNKKLRLSAIITRNVHGVAEKISAQTGNFSSGEVDATRKTFNLDTGSQRFRFYLVWITSLPTAQDGGGFRAAISELKLFG